MADVLRPDWRPRAEEPRQKLWRLDRSRQLRLLATCPVESMSMTARNALAGTLGPGSLEPEKWLQHLESRLNYFCSGRFRQEPGYLDNKAQEDAVEARFLKIERYLEQLPEELLSPPAERSAVLVPFENHHGGHAPGDQTLSRVHEDPQPATPTDGDHGQLPVAPTTDDTPRSLQEANPPASST